MTRSLIAALVLALSGVATAQQEILNAVKGATEPVRVPVRFADPWMIKALLEGYDVRQPEISTVMATQSISGGGGFGGGSMGGGMGGGPGSGGIGGGSMGGGGQLGTGGGGSMGPGNPGGGGPGQGGGGNGQSGNQGRGLLPAGWRIMVNPTDNSIWIIPPR